jgi:hypothetical protein
VGHEHDPLVKHLLASSWLSLLYCGVSLRTTLPSSLRANHFSFTAVELISHSFLMTLLGLSASTTSRNPLP